MLTASSSCRRLLVAAALLCTGVAAPRPGLGQPILHEPVFAPSLRCQDGLCRREGEGGAGLPDAVLSEDGLVGAPLGNRNPREHEPVFSSANLASPLESALMRGAPPPGHDPPPVRRLRVGPDADTGPEPPGERAYHEVFNPAIFPYKRMTTVDAVDESGNLYVFDRRRQALPGNVDHLSPGRDPFYGSVVVDFVAGELVALPTPAAAVHLLSYQVTPPQPLAFFLDGADNLYVLAARGGRHRLVYLVDAEQRYFAGPLFSPAARRAGVRLDALPAVPPLPPRLRRDADKVLRHLGIRPSPGADYAQILGRLVEYFRSFQIGELADDDADRRSSLYLRIALSQHGVCRHRAYAFVVTALAAGIPARYVENELHVFVEVFIPGENEKPGYWRRINLGGAPLQQRVYGGESRDAYQEKGGDPFERPEAFSHGVEPQVTGLPRRPVSANNASTSVTAGTGGGTGGGIRSAGPDSAQTTGSLASGRQAVPAPLASGKPAPATGGTAGPSPSTGPSLTSSQQAGSEGSGIGDRIEQPDDLRKREGGEALIATTVTVAATPGGTGRRIYRGAAVNIHGRVEAKGGSPAKLEVLLLLAVPRHAFLLGRTVTHEDGSFETDVEIPPDAPLGQFRIVARVRGDEKRLGSSSGAYDRLLHSETGTEDFVENE